MQDVHAMFFTTMKVNGDSAVAQKREKKAL